MNSALALKADTTYVNTQDALRVLKAGDTMTGDLKNTGGEFWPYKGGDTNRSCRLFANNDDGATYTAYNGGLKSWYGIAFYCSNDSTVRHVFNTRDGSTKQTGQIDCGSLYTTGAITTTGALTADSVSSAKWVRQSDYRTGMKPSNQQASTMGYYFGKMGNDGTGSYTDMLCFNSWSDSSAGNVNLVMFNKGDKGIRQFQGTYGSASNFSTWYDCVMTDANSGNVGITGTVSIGIGGTSANTTPALNLSSAFSHVDNSPGQVYLFTGFQGHLAIGRDTARDATTTNLCLGVASTGESQLISVNTNNTAYQPMSFASSKYVFTNGNVCIGNGTPHAPLQIVNGIGNRRLVLFEDADNDHQFYGFGINAYTLRFQIPSSSSRFAFFAGASTVQSNEIMRIQGDGTIGIGTTNPYCSLYNFGMGTSGWKGQSYFGNENTGVIIGTYNNKAYVGGHNSTLNAWTDIYLAPSAKCCVGDTTPSYKLHVVGDAYASGSLIFGANGTYTAGCIYSDTNWGCIIRSNQATPGIAKFAWTDYNDSHQMRISTNGVLNFFGGATAYAVPTGLSTIPGALVIGATDKNYTTSWGAGILMECSNTTSITVHDAAERLASFMYYGTDKVFHMGQDAGSGWGTTACGFEGNMYYYNPPAQTRNGSAGYGAVLGWDVIDKTITANVIEYYHNGPYNNYYQASWNGANRTNQFYKSSVKQCLWITGYATAYLSVGGWMDIRIRLYNQSTGGYYYYSAYQFYNATSNHQLIMVNIDAGGIPAGWYDVYTYFTSSNQYTDSNDVLSLTYVFLPNGLTSP